VSSSFFPADRKLTAQEVRFATRPIGRNLTKGKWNPGIAYFRLVIRETASATNERTPVCAFLRPGFICNHKAGIEVMPQKRSDAEALTLLAILNSYFAD
jgi:hypothetical protein